MAVFTAIAVAAVAASAYVGYKSYKAQKAAAGAQRKAQAAEQRRADIQNARERRFAVRNARVARASIEAQAAGTGLVGSSSVAAAMSNVTGRTNENLSFLDQTASLSTQASNANIAASKYASDANKWAAIGDFTSSVASMGMDYFGPKPQGTS